MLKPSAARMHAATLLAGLTIRPRLELELELEPEPKADPFRDVLELAHPRPSRMRFGKAYGEQGQHGSRKDRARRHARAKRRRLAK